MMPTRNFLYSTHDLTYNYWKYVFIVSKFLKVGQSDFKLLEL